MVYLKLKIFPFDSVCHNRFALEISISLSLRHGERVTDILISWGNIPPVEELRESVLWNVKYSTNWRY